MHNWMQMLPQKDKKGHTHALKDNQLHVDILGMYLEETYDTQTDKKYSTDAIMHCAAGRQMIVLSVKSKQTPKVIICGRVKHIRAVSFCFTTLPRQPSKQSNRIPE